MITKTSSRMELDISISPLIRSCLVSKKICKKIQILRHIESLDVCIEY